MIWNLREFGVDKVPHEDDLNDIIKRNPQMMISEG
jgi:hypothetical protein